MGADHQEQISKGLRRPRQQSNQSTKATWEACDALLLQECITAASNAGGALRFGLTRDGGAYSIGVYYGSDYFTDYVRPGEDLSGYLSDLIGAFKDAGAVPKLAPKSNSRKRA